MATKYKKFTGKANWAKLFDFNMDDYQGSKRYAVDLYLDADEQKLYEESGIQLQPIKNNTDYPDRTGYRFKCLQKQLIKDEVVIFGAPTVTDVNGDPFEELIGNGSMMEINVSVFDTKNGKGHRLLSAKVLEHVEYHRSEPVEGSNKTAVSDETKVEW